MGRFGAIELVVAGNELGTRGRRGKEVWTGERGTGSCVVAAVGLSLVCTLRVGIGVLGYRWEVPAITAVVRPTGVSFTKLACS